MNMTITLPESELKEAVRMYVNSKLVKPKNMVWDINAITFTHTTGQHDGVVYTAFATLGQTEVLRPVGPVYRENDYDHE